MMMLGHRCSLAVLGLYQLRLEPDENETTCRRIPESPGESRDLH